MKATIVKPENTPLPRCPKCGGHTRLLLELSMSRMPHGIVTAVIPIATTDGILRECPTCRDEHGRPLLIAFAPDTVIVPKGPASKQIGDVN